MTVGTFLQSNFTTQTPGPYKSAIDSDFMVGKRFLDAFAPHAQTTPDMTVAIDAGFTFGGSLTEVAAQNTAAISASSRAGITRIDRIVGDMGSGTVSVVAGTSVVPSIPSGKFPIAQVAVTTGSTAITNSMLTDERVTPPVSAGSNYQEFLSTGTFSWNAPTGFSTNANVLVMLWAAGGGGGSNAQGGGGGGGAAMVAELKLSSLTTSVSVTIPAGGAVDTAGGNASFGSLTVYGGAGGQPGSVSGGGGGGVFSAGSGATGGSPLGGSGSSPGGPSNFGGAGAGDANGRAGGVSVYGGAGGGGGNSGGVGGAGGQSFYGGGGGGSVGTGGNGAGGTSFLGGNGGNANTAGSQPGGGGGRNAIGGAGACRVWVFP